MEPITVVVREWTETRRRAPARKTTASVLLLVLTFWLGGCSASPASELERLTNQALSAVTSCDHALMLFAEGELPDTTTETLLGDMTRSLRETEQSIAELADAPKSERRAARASTRSGGDACASARASLENGTINSRIDTKRSTLRLVSTELDAIIAGLEEHG